MKRFFWLAGESFFVSARKQEIIDSFKSKDNYLIKILPEMSSVDELISTIIHRDIFNQEKTIFIYREKLPDFKKVEYSILKKIPKNFVFILITDKIDKRQAVFKQLKSDLEFFESAQTTYGFDKKILTFNKNKLKKIVNWKGNNLIFDQLLELCQYDCGIFFQELQKMRIYLGKDNIDSISEIKDIISGYESNELNKLVNCINNKNLKMSLELINKNLEIIKDDESMLYFYAILENFYFMMTCRMALDSSIRDPNKIGDFVSENLKKNNGEKYMSQIATKRYFILNKSIEKRSLEEYLSAIKFIKISIEDKLIGKYSDRYILNRLVSLIS